MVPGIILLMFLSTFFDISVHAAPPSAPVAKTGQTSCFQEKGITVINCSGTGQDGDTLAGISWPNPRFADNGDKTITDLLTGLVWLKNANTTGAYTSWQQALDYINNLNSRNYLGYNDWRLPNVNELESLVNKQSNLVDWLSEQGFFNIQVEYYWTSTTYVTLARYVWGVSMYGGIVAGRNKADAGYVWPVRRGQTGALNLPQTGQTTCFDNSVTPIPCAGTGQDGELRTGAVWPSLRFMDNGDLTITDSLTGLVWSRDGKAPGPAACFPGIQKTQQEALDYVACLNSQKFLGKSDWRLPDRNELASLINRGETNSALYLNYQGFSNVESSGYWSSTSYAYATWNAWIVNMHDGAVTPIAKKIYANVWPIRGGYWKSLLY